MRNQTYYCRMSGGNIHRVEFATSAGEAIHQSLWFHRGNTVTECWQGPEFQDQRYPKGQIHYQVPAHDAIPHDAEKPKRTHAKDSTEAFPFLAESPTKK